MDGLVSDCVYELTLGSLGAVGESSVVVDLVERWVVLLVRRVARYVG